MKSESGIFSDHLLSNSGFHEEAGKASPPGAGLGARGAAPDGPADWEWSPSHQPTEVESRLPGTEGMTEATDRQVSPCSPTGAHSPQFFAVFCRLLFFFF